MDIRTGTLYPSKTDGIAAGVPRDQMVEMWGDEEAIHRVADRVAFAARSEAETARIKTRRQQAKASRRRNRRR